MDDLNLIDPSLLPPRIKRLMTIIGLPQTLRLLQQYGGAPCYIPTTVEHSQKLNAVLAPAAIAALAASDLAGIVIELPKDDKITKQLRNLAIRSTVERTNKIHAAREFNLTRRHVINICKDDDQNPTLDLFSNPVTE